MKFAEMTFPQLRQVPRDKTLVLAPIAACEQHSQHLPTFTDTITGPCEAGRSAKSPFTGASPLEMERNVELNRSAMEFGHRGKGG